jgi:NADH-quinone oxidoreductase subunit J
MSVAFYIAGLIAVVATALAITRAQAVHALLYLLVALLSLAVVYLTIGANLAAALEIVVYAGAIMVLFLFVVMLMNEGERAVQREMEWLKPSVWAGPAILSALLLGELLFVVWSSGGQVAGGAGADPQQVGAAMFGPYLLAVELAAVLLLSAMVGVFHLGRREEDDE